MSDSFNYDEMVQDALMQVVRQALSQAAKDGLPGNHHFYLTFETNRPDVLLSDSLKSQHPLEMTIVLQHQYWDLKVTATAFQVTLSFDGESQEITVPFGAITNFLDPAVKFGLQFDPKPAAPALTTEKGAAAAATKKEGEANKVVTLDAFRKK